MRVWTLGFWALRFGGLWVFLGTSVLGIWGFWVLRFWDFGFLGTSVWDFGFLGTSVFGFGILGFCFWVCTSFLGKCFFPRRLSLITS